MRIIDQTIEVLPNNKALEQNIYSLDNNESHT
jgi:hypothetical protein